MILCIAKYANYSVIKLIKSVNFKEAHIANHLMHLTETFTVKLLQIAVSDASPRKVLGCILLIELTKIINFSRLNARGGTNQILIRGGSARRSNPLPFYNHFGRKGTPFIYLLSKKGTPFGRNLPV